MTAQLTSNTAALVQQTVQSFLITPLVPASALLQAGPTIFDTNAPIRVPRVGATSASFVGEGQTIPVAQAAFDEVDMLPSTIQSIKTIIPISRELVRSAVLGVTTILEQRVVQDVALALDNAFFQGTGTAGTNIIGLINQTGISTQTLVADASPVAAGSLQDPGTYLTALATAASNFVNPTHWFVHPTTWYGTILQGKDTLGRLLVTPDPTGATPGRLFGVPVVVTAHVPVANVLLVDIAKVLVARDLSPSVDVLLEAFATTDEIGVRVVARFDLALAHPQAVTLLH